MPFTCLALSGGAHLCIPFVGFLQAARPLLRDVRCVAGCSGGALVAAVWVLDVPGDVVLSVLARHMAGGLLRSPDLARLFDRFGMSDSEETIGRLCRDLLDEGLRRWRTIGKGWEPDPEACDGTALTMLDLAKLTGKSLAVGACDASNGFRETYLTAESHPRLEVWRALAASCAVPFAFTPVEVGGSLLCDPCVRDTDPARGLPGSAPPGMVDTLSLEVNLTAGLLGSPARPDDLAGYARGVLGAVLERAGGQQPLPRARVVTVPRWTEDRLGPMVVGADAGSLMDAFHHGVGCGKDFLGLFNSEAPPG